VKREVEEEWGSQIPNGALIGAPALLFALELLPFHIGELSERLREPCVAAVGRGQ